MIQKIVYLTLFLLFPFGSVFSQNIVELTSKLKTTSGVKKVELLIQLSDSLFKEDKLSKMYANEALRISKKLKYHKGEVLSLIELSRYESFHHDYNSAIKNATRALQLVEKHKISDINIEVIHQKLANSLYGLGAYSAAIVEKKIQLNERLKRQKEFDQGYYYLIQSIGLAYMNLEKYDSAIVYFKQAQNIAIQIDNSNLIGSSNNDIGFSYLEMGKKKEALVYFKKAEGIFSKIESKSDRDKLLLGFIRSNIAECIDPKDPRVLVYLNEFMRVVEDYGKSFEIIQAYLQFADYHLKRNNLSKTIDFLDKAYELIHEDPINTVEYKTPLFKLYTEVYVRKGEVSKAEYYLNVYMQMQDSLYGSKGINNLLNNHSNYRLSKIQQELQLEKLESTITSQKNETLKTKDEVNTLRITLLIIAIILIVALSLFFYFKIKKDNLRKQKAQELETKVLELDNAKKTERLTQSVLGLQRKQEFSEELISRLSAISYIDKKDLNSIKLFINNELDIDESVLEMEKFINETGKDFFIKLEQVHPELSDSDIKFTALIRMNLTIKQISVIRNITPQSVKIAKNRLSKKLNLEPGSSIYDYLISLTQEES